jgi:hypothetical protein
MEGILTGVIARHRRTLTWQSGREEGKKVFYK